MDTHATLTRGEIDGLSDRLVRGLTGLAADGRFDEPNLDGTPGDYVSFDSWEWPQGVGLYGLFRAWEFSGDDRYRHILEDWYARRIAAGTPPVNVNTTAPMLALALLWAKTGDDRWRPALDAWAERVMTELPRTEEGGFQHIVSDGINPGEIWVDTIFMVVMFLAAHGRATGRQDLVDEAQRQVLLHVRYLTDTRTGLWFHGWTFLERSNFARAPWCRGNAWAIAGLLDYLDIAGTAGGVRAYLLECLRAHGRALLACQDADGGWRTLLDDPSSYVEMSGTAGIAYGLLRGARLGLFGDEARVSGLRALSLVVRSVDADGTLQQVSYGTRMGRDLQHYRDIPIQPTAYGQALALLLMTEAVHHVPAG
jgi:unsaturated rhamnogalacturonyl hydrolase